MLPFFATVVTLLTTVRGKCYSFVNTSGGSSSDILIFEKLVIFHIGAKILGGEYFDLKKQKFYKC